MVWKREGNNGGGGRRGLTSSSEHDGPKTPDPKAGAPSLLKIFLINFSLNKFTVNPNVVCAL